MFKQVRKSELLVLVVAVGRSPFEAHLNRTEVYFDGIPASSTGLSSLQEDAEETRLSGHQDRERRWQPLGGTASDNCPRACDGSEECWTKVQRHHAPLARSN